MEYNVISKFIFTSVTGLHPLLNCGYQVTTPIMISWNVT